MPNQPLIDAIVAIKKSNEALLFTYPGVTGVDVGFKYVDNQMTQQISIRVHVKDKKNNHQLDKKDVIPPTIDGVPTDVIVRNYRGQVFNPFLPKIKPPKPRLATGTHPTGPDTKLYTKLEGGISMGPNRIFGMDTVYTGTLGAVVTDNVTGAKVGLSCYHVMSPDGLAAIGDQMDQPSLFDADATGNGIGGIVRLSLDNVDCAIVSIDTRHSLKMIVDVGAVAGTSTVTLGDPVRKRGRTTLLTYGSVESISLSKFVDLGMLGTVFFTNQMSIAPNIANNALFCDAGDSGSALVNAGNNMVGLVTAGTGAGHGGFGICNHIASVESALNITV